MVSIEISFKGSENDGTLFASIRNPADLSSGLLHQLTRYGLTAPSRRKPNMAGTLNGTRRAITELIQTYGFAVQEVPFEEVSAG